MSSSSDPETAAGLVAAATVSKGCGVSLRGGLAICQRSRRAQWDRRVKDLQQCSSHTSAVASTQLDVLAFLDALRGNMRPAVRTL